MLSISFTSIKLHFKYVKVDMRIELVIRKNDLFIIKAKNIMQLPKYFLLYDHIILHFMHIIVKSVLQSGLVAYINQLLCYFMVYPWKSVCLFHFYFY